MTSFFKTLPIFLLIAGAAAKTALPAIGSLEETHCAGGKITEASYVDPQGEVVKTTVSCPNGIPALNATTASIATRQNNVCGMGCTPSSCFGAPDPSVVDCDKPYPDYPEQSYVVASILIAPFSHDGWAAGTFLAGASTTTQYSIGTCTCAFLSGVTQFECNESLAEACRSIQSACSSGPGDCFGPTIPTAKYQINLQFN